MDWIQVTGRWHLRNKTAEREKNIASAGDKSVDERHASRCAAREENHAKEQVKKATER